MKKIYLKGEEPRKQLYRWVIKEFSKSVNKLTKQALTDIDRMNRDLMQNKDNKK